MSAPAPGAYAAPAAKPAGGDAAAGQGPASVEVSSSASTAAELSPKGDGAAGGSVGSRAGVADGSRAPAAALSASCTATEGGEGGSQSSSGRALPRRRKKVSASHFSSVGVSQTEHLFVSEDKDELKRHLQMSRVVSKTTAHISRAQGPQEILEWIWTSCKQFWERRANISLRVCLRENLAPENVNASQQLDSRYESNRMDVQELCGLDLRASAELWANSPAIIRNEDVCQWFGMSARLLPSEWTWHDLDQRIALRLCFQLSQVISDVLGPQGFEYAEHHEAEFKSWVYLPLAVREECVGVVVMASTSPEAFPPADIDIYQAVAEVAAVHLKSQQMQFEMGRRRIAVEMDRARHRELASAYRELLNDMLPSHVVDELREVRRPSDSPGRSASSTLGDSQAVEQATEAFGSEMPPCVQESEACGASSIPVLVEDNSYASMPSRRQSKLSRRCSTGIPSHITSQLDKLTYAEYHECVAILFSDVKGFTGLSEVADPAEIMLMLDDLFGRFDGIVERHAPAAYKVETIGDAYMIAFGLFGQTGFAEDTPTDYAVALRAIVVGAEMIQQSKRVMTPSRAGHARPVEIRVGIHFGRIMSGIIGRKVPRYCMFGDTVNTASRMESTGVPGQIHVSDSVCRACMQGRPGKDLPFSSTGGMKVKGKGWMRTFLLDAQKVIDLEICPPDDYTSSIPFQRRRSLDNQPPQANSQRWSLRLARLVDALCHCRGRGFPGARRRPATGEA